MFTPVSLPSGALKELQGSSILHFILVVEFFRFKPSPGIFCFLSNVSLNITDVCALVLESHKPPMWKDFMYLSFAHLGNKNVSLLSLCPYLEGLVGHWRKWDGVSDQGSPTCLSLRTPWSSDTEWRVWPQNGRHNTAAESGGASEKMAAAACLQSLSEDPCDAEQDHISSDPGLFLKHGFFVHLYNFPTFGNTAVSSSLKSMCWDSKFCWFQCGFFPIQRTRDYGQCEWHERRDRNI